MGKQELLDILNRTTEIEKLLTPVGGDFMPGIKTINRNVDFQIWRAELKRQLLKMDQETLVVEILQLLDNGFKNGWEDEKDFINLKGRLSVLSSHIDDYFVKQTKENMVSEKLKKGTVVKTAFNEYKLIKQVGVGGNGRVFSAIDNSGEQVAVKFVERNIGGDKLKRFKNEISFCEHYKHKNIVEIQDRGYAYLDDKDYVFYVMPLYAETLKDKIKAGIPHEKILDIFVGLLEGLKFAHQHGSIHRDIKPENIMFAEDSVEPVICDFGIAHFAEEDLLTIIETKATDRMANFQYAAPEQRKKGGNVCFQTDIYALALILNEMFTGEIPQAAGYKKIRNINDEYAFLDDVFDQLFKQNPEDRLYPEDIILSEIRRLAEKYKRDAEKKVLQSKIDNLATPDDFNAIIIGKSYADGLLTFEFNQELPDDWTKILIRGSYSCTEIWGYEHSKLEIVDSTKVGMPLRGDEREDTLKDIVSYMQNWVSSSNYIYSQTLKTQAKQEHQRKEQERQARIRRLEQANNISSIIAKL